MSIGPEIGRALQEIDSRAAIAFMRSWDTQIDAAVFPVRVLTMLLTLFAGGSLFIAVIGQYAVVSFDMRRSVRELGLRMALGASAKQVLTVVYVKASRLTIVGVIIGFALSLAAGRVLGQRAVWHYTDRSAHICWCVCVALGRVSCGLLSSRSPRSTNSTDERATG